MEITNFSISMLLWTLLGITLFALALIAVFKFLIKKTRE